MSDALRVLGPDEVRLRRRPLAIAIVFGWQLAWGWIAAQPWHAWAGRAFRDFPDADAGIFRPGGYDLLAWLNGAPEALATAVRTSLVLLAVGAVLGQVPLGAATASLALGRGEAARPPRAVTALARGAAAFAPLTGILVLATAIQLVVVGVGALVASAIGGALVGRLGDVPAVVVRVALTALAVFFAAVVGVVADLARAAAVRDLGVDEPAGSAWKVAARAVRVALRASRRGLVRAVVAWGWRAALGALAVLAGAVVAHGIGARTFGAVAALWLVHQLVVAIRSALRASWLARAVAVAGRVQDTPIVDAPIPAEATPAPGPADQRATDL